MEARERWLAGERNSLEAKIREATAPSTAGRDRHLQAAAALRSEVEALRCALAPPPDLATRLPLHELLMPFYQRRALCIDVRAYKMLYWSSWSKREG